MTDIWFTRLDNISDTLVQRYRNELDDKFVRDIDRYKLETDRRSRIVARKMIGMYLMQQGADTPHFELLLDEYKKPYLEEGPHLNISHSGNFVLVSFSDQPVGVDVEEKKQMDWEPIAEMMHEEEQRCLSLLEEKTDVFFRIWARKEAFLKAVGSGILNGIGTDCVLDELLEKDGRTWYIQDIELDPGYAAAVCSPFRGVGGNTIRKTNINTLLI
jgi:4'-phosphopantetheinyl transferase